MVRVKIILFLSSLWLSYTLLAECNFDNNQKDEAATLTDDLQKILRELPYAVDEHVLHLQISERKTKKKGPHFTCFINSNEEKPCTYIYKSYDDFESLKLDISKILPDEYVLPVEETLMTKFSENSGRFSEKRISLVIALDNDSRMYSAIRLMTHSPHEDDEGYTHGLNLDASATFPNFKNIKLGAGYSSQMFTKGEAQKERAYCEGLGVSGEDALNNCMLKHRFQFFNNVNRLYLTAGQNPLYGPNWNSRIGFMEYNHDDPTHFYNGTAQQNVIHKIFGVTVPENDKDNKGIKRGFLLEGSVGYQAWPLRFWSNRVLVTGGGSADLNVSNLSKYTAFRLNEGADVKLQSQNGTVGIGISGQASQTFHADGVQSTLTFGGEFFAGPFVLKYLDTAYYGSLYNFGGYNLPGRYSQKFEKTGAIFIMVDFNHWARRRDD